MEEKQYHVSRQDCFIAFAIFFIILPSIFIRAPGGWIIVGIFVVAFAYMFSFRVSFKNGIWIFKGALQKTLRVNDEDLEQLDIDKSNSSRPQLIVIRRSSEKKHNFGYFWDVAILFRDLEAMTPERLSENVRGLFNWREKIAKSRPLTLAVIALIMAVVNGIIAIIIAVNPGDLEICKTGALFSILFSVWLFSVMAIRIYRVQYAKPDELWATLCLLPVVLVMLVNIAPECGTFGLPAIIGYGAAFAIIGLRSLFASGVKGSIVAAVLSITAILIGIRM